MSITSSTPFLSIIIAPKTTSSKSIACGGNLPFSKLIIEFLSIFNPWNDADCFIRSKVNK